VLRSTLLKTKQNKTKQNKTKTLQPTGRRNMNLDDNVQELKKINNLTQTHLGRSRP
jgi:hypothetical protein